MAEKNDEQQIRSTDNNQSAADNPDVIDLLALARNILHHKKTFAIILPIVFVLACIHIFSVPRYYTTSTSLAPEMENPSSAGGLSSLASTFGIDISQIQTTDAITPLLYPELMSDNRFVTDLFKIQVRTSDGALKCDYFTYLSKHQKSAWYESLLSWMGKIIGSSKKPSGNVVEGENVNNPYILPKNIDDVAKAVRRNIEISVDKKTGVITISSTSQDPLVCKIVADSVTRRLQAFITTYRTNKARKDVIYYKHLRDEAKKNYETTRRKYAAIADANQDAMLETVKSEMEDIENDMQLKYNQYTTYDTQYQAAIARLRENTPAFTTLKGANVPVLPSGPKRMLFVLGMLLLAFIVTALYIAKGEITKSIKH